MTFTGSRTGSRRAVVVAVAASAVLAASPAAATGPLRPAFTIQTPAALAEAPARKGLGARRKAERAQRRAQRVSCDREAREKRLGFFWRQRFLRICMRAKR